MYIHVCTCSHNNKIKTILSFPCATNLKEDLRGDDFKKPLQSDFPHQHQAVITN